MDAAQDASLRVLIVEDDPQMAHALDVALRKSGYTTAAAEDGSVAIPLAKEFRPDAVILDVSMPRMNGLDVLVALRSIEQTHATPVVVFTNHTEPALIEQLFELGAVEHWDKTRLDPERVCERLRGIIERRRTKLL
jgi:CheY-like chemotaxis protein